MLRSYFLLISLSLVLTALSSYLFWSSHTTEGQEASIVDIQEFKREFKSKYKYAVKLEENQLADQISSPRLLDPKSILPQLNRQNKGKLRRLHRYSKSCSMEPPRRMNQTLKKAWDWQRYLCGDLAELDSNFFKKPPFLHPLGGSYSWRAVKSKNQNFSSSVWIMEHIQTFHVLEWKKLRKFIKATSSYNKKAWALATFDMATLEAIKKKQDLIIAPKFVLFRDLSIQADQPYRYHLYNKKQFKKFLTSSRFQIRHYHPRKSCILKEGIWCWDYNHQSFFKKINDFSISITILLLISVGVSIWITLRWIKRQEIDREHKSLMLSMLTHELRTPVTSLVLAIENLKKEFHQIPESIQDDFFEILDNASRLNNVVDRSSQYIQQSSQKIIQTRPATIPSMRQFLDSLVESIGGDWEIDLKQDFDLHTDNYWLRIGLGNLMRNALEHGQAPYKLKATSIDKHIELEVIDGGELIDTNLLELKKEFNKSPQSHGLGLGLYLVSNIAKALGGDIGLKLQPTTFKLKIKKSL